jgi:hypothetical protein
MNKLRMTLGGIACVATVAGVLAGCSGSSATASPAGGPTPPPITGIATPSSVSVVTATK